MPLSTCNHFRDRYYTDANDPRQTYDLVIPPDASGSAGLILCIHGGGWVEGSKDEYAKTLKQVSERSGVAAACINYRYVSETVSFDDVLDDVASALAAIKTQGRACGVDFDRVLLTGVSAGGHISLLYAYTRKDVSPVRPVCVVELCGPTNLEDEFYYSDENIVNHAVGKEYFRRIISHGVRFDVDPDHPDEASLALKRFSPINHIDKTAVPTVFGHGEQDGIVPYRNALDLERELTEFGVTHRFISFPNSGHGCEDETSKTEILDLLFRCADKYLK